MKRYLCIGSTVASGAHYRQTVYYIAVHSPKRVSSGHFRSLPMHGSQSHKLISTDKTKCYKVSGTRNPMYTYAFILLAFWMFSSPHRWTLTSERSYLISFLSCLSFPVPTSLLKNQQHPCLSSRVEETNLNNHIVTWSLSELPSFWLSGCSFSESLPYGLFDFVFQHISGWNTACVWRSKRAKLEFVQQVVKAQ